MNLKRYGRYRDLDKLKKEEFEKKAKNKTCIAISDKIREYMIENDMFDYDFAKLAGVSKTSMSAYINATSEPTAVSLLKIAKAMNISVDHLLGKKKFKSPHDDVEYIHKITGLSEEAIMNLKRINGTYKSSLIDVINFLIEEDPYYPEEEYLYSRLVEIDNDNITEEEKNKLKNEVEKEIDKYNELEKKNKPSSILSKLEYYFTTWFNKDEIIYPTKNGTIFEKEINDGLQRAFINATSKKIIIGNKLADSVLLDEVKEVLKTSKSKYRNFKRDSDN